MTKRFQRLLRNREDKVRVTSEVDLLIVDSLVLFDPVNFLHIPPCFRENSGAGVVIPVVGLEERMRVSSDCDGGVDGSDEEAEEAVSIRSEFCSLLTSKTEGKPGEIDVEGASSGDSNKTSSWRSNSN